MISSSSGRVRVNNIENDLFKREYPISPCTHDLVIPVPPVAVDFDDAVLKALWGMDVLRKP